MLYDIDRDITSTTTSLVLALGMTDAFNVVVGAVEDSTLNSAPLDSTGGTLEEDSIA